MPAYIEDTAVRNLQLQQVRLFDFFFFFWFMIEWKMFAVPSESERLKTSGVVDSDSKLGTATVGDSHRCPDMPKIHVWVSGTPKKVKGDYQTY